MKRVCSGLALVAALLTLAPAAHAQRLGAGNSMIWLGLNGSKSQLVGPTTGAGNMFEADELGLHAAYSYFVSDNWTVALSGGFDVGNEKFEPAAGTEEKFTSSSFNVRLGMDRYAFINDDVAIYAGPGLLYWKGKGEYEGGGIFLDGEWPETSQVAFNGRLGMYARLGSGYGLFGHVGHVIAMNTADDDDGENSWWSTHNEGSVGLAFNF